jgi:SAM-dependent methyltransferase
MMKSPGSLIASHFPRLLYGIYLSEVAKALEGCSSVLDVGCGSGSPLCHLGIERLVGVDGYAPAIEEARSYKTHHEYHLADVRTIGSAFPAKSFDACVALDLIEHLPKEEGRALLAGMESIARRRVIIFTPNGFVPQRSRDGDLQEHVSGWDPAEMRGLGYRVLGLHGPKFLRGEYHKSKFLPRPIAGVISSAAHVLYTRRRPESAAAILCIKSLDAA